MKQKHGLVIAFMFAASLVEPAHAQEVEVSTEPPTAAPPPHAPNWTESPAWGWILVGSSVALGAAMTASGLAVDCRGERQCRVDTSLLVWGGLGVASLGSMFGFVILERAEKVSDSNAVVFTAGGRF
jgi:hypothetical protein